MTGSRGALRAGALWAGLGGGVSILLPLVMFVIFARVLPPVVIGQFALAVALSEMLKMLGAPGLYEAMLQRRDNTGRDQGAASGVFIVAGLLLVPAQIALIEAVLALTGSLPPDGQRWLLWLVALRIPLDLAVLQPQAELARRQAFARLAQRNMAASAGAAGLGLAAVLAGLPVLGLALYTLGSSVFATLATVWGTATWRWPRWAPAALRDMAPEAAPASAVRGASVALIQMDQLVLGALLGPVAFAHYNFGKRIEMAYVSLANSFSQTLFQPLFAARQAVAERGAALRQALGLVTATGGAGAAVFIATADLAVPLLLGSDWAPAVPVAAMLALAGHGRALASAFASLLSVSGGNGVLFRCFLASAAIGLAMVALAAPMGAMAVAGAVTLRVLGTAGYLAWQTRAMAGDAWGGALLQSAVGFGALLAVAVCARSLVVLPGGTTAAMTALLAIAAAAAAVGALALVLLLRLAPRRRLATS